MAAGPYHDRSRVAVRFALLLTGWLVAACGSATAAPVDVYQGTLGGAAPVVMELGAADASGQRTGRYFYRRFGVDIPLNGSADGWAEALPLDFLKVDEPNSRPDEGPVFKDPSTGRPGILWKGRFEGARFYGVWHNFQTGKSLPFDVHRIATYDPEAPAPGSTEPITQAIAQRAGNGMSVDVEISTQATPYDYLRLDVPPREGKEIVRGSVAYRMVTDTRTRFAYPRLTRHPDATVRARINRLLQQRHWHMSLEALACVSTRYTASHPAAGTLGNLDNEKVEVTYLSPTLMSAVESGSTYCGGAHPHNHYDPFTLDLVRGGYLDFSQLLRGIGRGEYGSVTYNPAFMAFVQRQIKVRAVRRKSNTDTSEMDAGFTGIWPEYLSLHFEQPQHLAFDVSGVPHVAGASLGTHLRVPFDALTPLLKRGSERYLAPQP